MRVELPDSFLSSPLLVNLTSCSARAAGPSRPDANGAPLSERAAGYSWRLFAALYWMFTEARTLTDAESATGKSCAADTAAAVI